MKTLNDNWNGAYWVCTSFESADGGSGWDSEYFGPFFTKNEAYAVASRLGGSGKPQPGESKYIVEISRSCGDEVETSCENSDIFPASSTNYWDDKYCGLRREYASE